MGQFLIPVTITTDGFLKVEANTYEEAFQHTSMEYCEVNIKELQSNENFLVFYEELHFPPSSFDE